jgi:4-oxalocrotonate tautomerase family enzyme
MPTIECYMTEGYTDGDKAALIGALTNAVVIAIEASADSVRTILMEVPHGQFGVAGRATAKADAQLVMQATLIAGRSAEQKMRLLTALSEAATERLGIPPHATRVIIRDVPNTEYGLGGQTAAALGRGIDRRAMRAQE